MKYETEGLFIGLVSYPFFVDGGKLFNDVFHRFFDDHRKHLEKICSGLSPIYYKPTAYRMLGSYGLALFSLIDDFAFPSRVFNPAHIDEDNDRFQDVSKCKATVIMGSSETSADGKPYLVPRSMCTFLAQRNSDINQKNCCESSEKLYPCVGIVRVKIKCSHLEGRGSALTRKVKEDIEALAGRISGGEDESLKIIIIDSYDSDELVVSSFSTSLSRICDLVEEIRNITDDSGKHIIEACHSSYGFHIDFDMDFKAAGFREWEKERDKSYKVTMLVETKPGHRDSFGFRLRENYCRFVGRDLSEREKEMMKPRVTITGGGVLFYEFHFGFLPWIYKETSSKDRWMRHNATRVKLTLSCQDKDSEPDSCDDKCATQYDDAIIEKPVIDGVKNNLAILGVSKTVRESVLSLFALYNYCVNKRLQCYYIRNLRQSVLNLDATVKGFLNPGDGRELVDIERTLNDEVKCLEMAICDRVNSNMEPNMVLEYVCGIQQMLYGFGTTYQTISRVLDIKRNDVYSFIVAKSKECTTKTHVELNINHLIYPELFVTTVWKEASNFSFDRMDDILSIIEDRKQYEIIRSFLLRLRDKRYQDELASKVYAELMNDADNQVCQHIMSTLHEDKLYLIKYVVSDAMVYRFAYQCDLSLMWESYFKVFLQMSGNYSRLGKVLMKPFVFLLLRLFLVAFSDIDNEDRNIDLVQDRISKPFDPILSSLWHLCYMKVMRASLCIYREWSYPTGYTVGDSLFCSVIKYVQSFFEKNIDSSRIADLQSIDDQRNRRSERVKKFKEKLVNHEVIDFNPDFTDSDQISTNAENVICVLNAFALAIHDLAGTEHKTIHRLLRNPEDGKIWFEQYRNEQIRRSSSNILADPDGGFVVPDPEVRKNYFAYRTWLYRTLWDLSYRGSHKLS